MTEHYDGIGSRWNHDANYGRSRPVINRFDARETERSKRFETFGSIATRWTLILFGICVAMWVAAELL